MRKDLNSCILDQLVLVSIRMVGQLSRPGLSSPKMTVIQEGIDIEWFDSDLMIMRHDTHRKRQRF
jgi:hypothetical protein